MHTEHVQSATAIIAPVSVTSSPSMLRWQVIAQCLASPNAFVTTCPHRNNVSCCVDEAMRVLEQLPSGYETFNCVCAAS